MSPRRSPKRVCLAYSGGLDTSVILHWLIDHYDCEVVAYCADVGQEEELSGLPEKARETGAVDCVVRDVREEFVRDYVFPAIRGAAIYDYLESSEVARLVMQDERETYGISNPEFGDFIAVLNEGLCFKPSTFARNIPAAMHGYHPEVSSQHAVLAHRGARPPAAPASRTLEVFDILDHALAQGRGKPGS